MEPMDQGKKKLRNVNQTQFLYLNRWVDKEHFRAFVYDAKGDQKLAGSYDEFNKLIDSGLWFETRENALAAEAKRGKRNAPLCSNSK